MQIERKSFFYHNPLVNLRTILAVEGAESGFNPSKEKVLNAETEPEGLSQAEVRPMRRVG